jgi:outer membrane receptor protein involved in Fe transport
MYLDTVHSTTRRRNLQTGAFSRPQSRFADGATMNSFALYGQSELWLHPRLTMTLGGRFS